MLTVLPTVDTAARLLNREKRRWYRGFFHTIFNERVGDSLVDDILLIYVSGVLE